MAWIINGMRPYNIQLLRNGILDGYGGTFGSDNLIVEDIIMNDARNDSNFTCVVVSRDNETTILGCSDPTILYIAGKQLLINTNDIFPCVNFYLLATLFGMML